MPTPTPTTRKNGKGINNTPIRNETRWIKTHMIIHWMNLELPRSFYHSNSRPIPWMIMYALTPWVPFLIVVLFYSNASNPTQKNKNIKSQIEKNKWERGYVFLTPSLYKGNLKKKDFKSVTAYVLQFLKITGQKLIGRRLRLTPASGVSNVSCK